MNVLYFIALEEGFGPGLQASAAGASPYLDSVSLSTSAQHDIMAEILLEGVEGAP